MNRRNNGYAARLMAAALATTLLVLAGCTGDKEQAKEEPTDLVWPLPPEQPRIKYVRSISSKEDIGATGEISVVESLLGKEDEESITQLRKPYGVHADRDGRIFVTDTGWGKILVFDTANKTFDVWGRSGQGYLEKPIGVTSDSMTGRIYVSDVEQKRVFVFDKEGEFVTAIGGTGELAAPTGIALDETRKRIYVVDVGKHHIAVFDYDGRLVSTIGERGQEPGQFNFPTNITVGPAGKLYVTDTMNFRVQILDPDGKPLKAFGENGRNFGQFSRAKGIAVDSGGHIYVVDAAFNNFQIFNQETEFLMFVGSNGVDAGQFWSPAGAYIDDENRIYVVDQFNVRIQVFQYLGEPEEQPAPEAASAETPTEPPTQ